MARAFYIDYNTLKDFYTLKEASDLLHTTRPNVKRLCEQYGVRLQTNSNNECGLTKASFSRLHYRVFYSNLR